MPTRNVVLTAQQEQLINNLVKTGHYQNASEVLREGLRLLQQRLAEDAAKIEALRHATTTGMTDLEHGRFTEIHEGQLQHYLAELGLEAAATEQEKH
ncbi:MULTISPECIES: type II toxin-antitoxin system ParD family antitoxin [Pseudomonas]|uniref:Antitoxin ParD n=1 Tax=Pseudomonas sessilinigenes TaxID=658629 RepID=A0ABX8MNR3_9PSED|nr:MULTISPECIES: type II toxin-antitoxin system ParD family antitoxin [Pseudomonas]AZC27306.1 putative transcriptional regulator, CopG/Arc/MetJ DNA-binding domain [Pseudomonas sessilinigenes]QXH38776.1 type II toxin-antitoxin system ParD family antitoxin [Pseudomonas sessilinigenes]UMZ09679.1 type II toxin-antitoxin system ParD family antitoxin [Pseudomonas sp. MPFS]